MSEIKIVGYKKMFGLILPDWITEKMIKTFVFGLFTCVVMILVYIFVVNPKFGEIKQLQKTLGDSKAELSSLKSSLTGINKMESDLNTDLQRKILSSVPMTYSPDRAIFILREIASQTGASIVSYSLPSGVLLDTNVTEAVGKKGEMVEFTSYPLKMVISAPVDVLLKFISKVETSLPFGVVSDLNLQEVTKLSKINMNKSVLITLEIKYFQSKLNKININKIVSLTDKNLEFANKLGAYEEISIDQRAIEENSPFNEASSSGDMFGL